MVGSNAKSVEIIFNAIDRTKGIFKGIDKSFGKIERSIDRVNKDLKSMGTSLQEVGMAATAIGTAIVFPFVGAIKKAGQFEKSMSRVKAVSGATEREFKKLTKTALELGRTTTYTASQAAEGFQFLAMAGIKAGDAIEALPSVLQLAQAGAMDLGTAADITTNILTAYRFEVEDLGHVNDVLVKAFISSNTTLMELGEGFKFVGPIARGLGTKFEDVIAVMGKLADAGIKASVAGTTLRGTISALFNPTGEEEKLMAALSDRIGGVGLQIRDSEGDFVGFGELIYQLEQASIKADEALKLFGLRAGPGIAALLGVGSKAIKEFTEELDNADGTSKKISKVMTDNFLGAVTRLGSAFDGLSISIGTPFLNDLAGVTDGLAATILVLTELHDAFGPVATAIDFVIFGLGGLWVAAAAIGTISAFILKPLLKFMGAIGLGKLILVLGKARLAVLALNLSFAGLPGILITAGVALATYGTAIAYATYKIVAETKAQAEAIEWMEKTIEKSAKILKALSKRLGIPIKDMAAFNKLVQENQIVRVAGKWELAADSIKVSFDKATAAVKKLKDEAIKALKGFEHASSMLALKTESTLLEVRRQLAEGIVPSESDAASLRDRIRVIEAKSRLDLANEVFSSVKLIYTKETDEFKAALLKKTASENAYLDARLIQNENTQKRIDELRGAKERVSEKLALEATKVEMTELENLLKKGEIVTKEFFDKRNELIETQFQEEIDLLDERIEKETDLIKIEELKLQRLQVEGKHRNAKIASIKEENAAYKELEQTKQRLQEIPERAQRRVMRDTSGLSLSDTQLQEEELLSNRHERELQRFQDMTVAKELEADKQLAITEILVAQEMELDNLRVEHRKQLNKAELQMQRNVAGDLGSIFGDMNEVFGEETKAFFLLKQAAAIAQAIINTQLAMTDAIAKNGGPLGLAQSSLLYAKGMASVAVIASQTIKGMATGGIVRGTSPHSKADNIPIMATAKEFIQPVDSVQHYGLPFMEGIRKKLIPKDIFKNFRLPSFSTPSFSKTNFAEGGLVTSSNNSYSVSVPVTVNGASEELSSRLQQGIEETVISIMREELA